MASNDNRTPSSGGNAYDADDLDSSGSMRTRRRGNHAPTHHHPSASSSSSTRERESASASTSATTTGRDRDMRGGASTRSRSPALPTKASRGSSSRSPVLPSSGGGGGGGGVSSSSAVGNNNNNNSNSGLRSSGRRSRGGGSSSNYSKLVTLDSSSKSNKEEENTNTPASKRRGPGRPKGRGSTPVGSNSNANPSVKKSQHKNGHGNDNSSCCNDDNDANDIITSPTSQESNNDNGSTTTTSPNTNTNTNKPLVLLGEKPRGLYECDYCGTDLTRAPRIRCADCPDFDLCLECFGTEDHERMAKYKREEEMRKRGCDSSNNAANKVGGGGGGVGVSISLVEENNNNANNTKVYDNKTKFGKDEKGAKRGRSGGSSSSTKSTHHKNKSSTSKARIEKDPNSSELGSYVNGEWVPYFKHNPSHGYLVADSTRYTLFPSFRGVRGLEVVNVDNVNVVEKKEKDDVENNNMDIDGGGGGADDDDGKLAKEAKVKIIEEEEVSSADPTTGNEKHSEKVVKEEESKKDKKEPSNKKSEVKKENDIASPPAGEKKSTVESDEKKKKLSGDAMDVDETVKKEEKESSDEKPAPDAAKSDASKDAMDVDSNDVGDGKAKKESMDKEPDGAKSSATEGKDVKTEDEPKASKTEAEEEGIKSNNETQTTKRFRVIDAPKDAWTAEEDLRLLDGILACGLGNWPDIAEHVNGLASGESGGTSTAGGDPASNNGVVIGVKTDKKCMERYLDDFMGRYGHILPPYTMVPVPEGEEDEEDEKDVKPAAAMSSDGSDGESRGTSVSARKRPRRSVSSSLVEDDSSAPGFKKVKFRVVPTEQLEGFEEVWPHPYTPLDTKIGDEVARDLWYRSEQSFVRQTASSNKTDAENFRKEFIERRAQNMIGYEANVLPPRLDDMKQLPGSELAGYMPRRGDFDMEWDNDAEKTISEMEFSAEDTKADRDLKLEVVRIFNRKLDEREKRKQFIIDQNLLNYRENQEKMWKMPPDERHLVQRLRLFARFHDSHKEHAAFVNKILEAKRLRKEIAKLQMYRRLGITSLADAERYEIDKARRELHRNAWLKKEEEKKKEAEDAVRASKENATGLSIPPPPLASNAAAGKLDGAIGAAANHSLQVWRQFKRSKESSSEKNPSEDTKESTSAEDKDISSAKFIIKDKPGYELLSKKEVGLCKRLRLLPREYLDAKKALISESLAQGMWNPAGGQKNKSIFKIDVTKRDGVIDFVLEAGWIPTRPDTV